MDKKERLDVYLSLLQEELPDYLSEIEREALKGRVPIIRKQSQYFMRFLMELIKPEKILEIGTAVGFSTLLMMEYNPVCCTIDTIESFEPRIKAAGENFAGSPYRDRIKLMAGDAMEILPTLSEKYDFIFLDAAKGQYVNMLPMIKKLMKPGSVLLTDNILQEGNLLESTFAIKRRDRTIHKRIREYLELISRDKDFVTDTLPMGDGMTIAIGK